MDRLIEFSNANIWLTLAIVAMTLAVIFNELRMKTQTLGSISPSQAVKLINDGALIIDIREEQAFLSGHLMEAKNLGPKEIANSKKLNSRKGLLLVCDNGTKSSRALLELRKAGIENAYSIKGGINAWLEENLPIERNI
jgi:rhodanese-related sulfurtransferase